MDDNEIMDRIEKMFVEAMHDVKIGEFDLMEQEEKIEYVRKEFKTLYDVDCKISEIKRRQISMTQNETLYCGTAYISRNRGFDFWVDNDGNIQDTYFSIEIFGIINEKYSNMVAKYYNIDDFSLYCNLNFDNPPKSSCDYNNMDAFLKSENVESVIFLFLRKKRDTDLYYLNEIQSMLKAYGGRMKVFYCNNPENVNFDNYDLTTQEYFYELK